MYKIKIIVYKFIWKIAGISPKWGNRVMDAIGYERYCKIGKILYHGGYLD